MFYRYIRDLHHSREEEGEKDTTAVEKNVSDEQSRFTRRTIMRYVLCSMAMVLCSITSQVKKSFPTDDHLVNAGLLRADELEKINKRFAPTFGGRYLITVTWATNLAARARREGRIRTDLQLRVICF